ncbi:MAG: cation:proton antiporter [Chromatiales bacterium]|nr:cation:proton antiporter [Chromatiales bacterium]
MSTHVLNDTLLLLAVAVFTVALFRRIHLPPILGYLFVGVMLGPHALGLLQESEGVHFLAEFGVVFLLFTIGLEFSLPKMIAMRGAVLGLGGAQVVITAVIVAIIALSIGTTGPSAFVLGGVAALSSTAIVVKQLVEQIELNQAHGTTALSILLFQDLAAIPFLVIIPVLAGEAGQSVWIPLVWAMLKATLVFGLIMAVGYWLLRPLFHEIARARSAELFTLAVLLVSLAAAWATHAAGLSLALGAFLAGMMLGETEYRHQIEGDIRPFQDVLLGLFFVTVGMRVDLLALAPLAHWVLLAAFGMMCLKALIIYAVVKRAYGSPATALRTALVLAQGGEFGFVLIDLALGSRALDQTLGQIALSAVILSMVLTPFLVRFNSRMARAVCARSYFGDRARSIDELSQEAKSLNAHVVVCGYGRIGQNLGRLLSREGFPFLAVDTDPGVVREAHDAGEPVHFGDATRSSILEATGLHKARLLVICFDDDPASLKILSHVRAHHSDLPVLVRTRNDSHLEDLEKAGATEVMPEAVEASLMMSSEVLLMLKVPGRRVIEIINEMRAAHYRPLRDFFHGERHEEHEGAFVERLHTITLPDGANAVGQTLAQADLETPGVTINAIRRDGVRSDAPESDTVLAAGDVLVVTGTPHDLEHAETVLLQG